jgi:hypothetical protein
MKKRGGRGRAPEVMTASRAMPEPTMMMMADEIQATAGEMDMEFDEGGRDSMPPPPPPMAAKAGGRMNNAKVSAAQPLTGGRGGGNLGKQFQADMQENGKDDSTFDSAKVSQMLVYTANVGLSGTFQSGYDNVLRLVDRISREMNEDNGGGVGFIENEGSRSYNQWINYDPEFKPPDKKEWDLEKWRSSTKKNGNTKSNAREERRKIRDFNRNRFNNHKGREIKIRGKNLTLRVPSDKYQEVMAKLLKVGVDVTGATVEDVNSSAKDVTTQFIDAESRAKTLGATRSALEKLMGNANGVQEVLQVQRELTNVITQIEQQKEMSKYLLKASSLASIYLKVNEEVPIKPTFEGEQEAQDIPYDDDDLDWLDNSKMWSPFRTVGKAFELFSKALTLAVDALIYSSIIGMPFVVLVAFLLSLLWKRFGQAGIRSYTLFREKEGDLEM